MLRCEEGGLIPSGNGAIINDVERGLRESAVFERGACQASVTKQGYEKYEQHADQGGQRLQGSVPYPDY